MGWKDIWNNFFGNDDDLSAESIHKVEKDMVKDWLKLNKIKGYTINEDLTVDVEGDVKIIKLDFKEYLDSDLEPSIPNRIQFGYVFGDFDCSNISLTTLRGCPSYVGGDFNCADNQLNSLEGGPKDVGGSFSCEGNHIESLKHAPSYIAEDFNCSDNQLTSLEYAPNIVEGNFKCYYNAISSLKHSPEIVNGDFECYANSLKSLEDGPHFLSGNFITDLAKDSEMADEENLSRYFFVENWLNDKNISNYTINDDLTVDVKGNVDLMGEELTEIPIQFGKVEGDFLCSHNNLTSLKGCPKEVGGEFNCSKNKLTSLEGGPEKVSGDFYCSKNILNSLEYCPENIGGNFNGGNNQLTSLEGAPRTVKRYFMFHDNPLENKALFDMNLEQIHQYNTSMKLSEQFHRTLSNPNQEQKQGRRMKL